MTKEDHCKVCMGTGLLRDDEGWQYECSVCHGSGTMEVAEKKPTRLLSVDENNRLLD